MRHAVNAAACAHPIRAVLFDFFGTLTHAVVRGAAHARVAEALGLPPDAFLPALDNSFYDRASGRYGSIEESLRVVAASLGATPSDAQLAAAAAARQVALRCDATLRGDAAAVLAGLKTRGLRTAVVSDCTHELPSYWSALPIARYVDTAVFSIDIGVCKPDPVMYETACKSLDVLPTECLYVGDGGSHELTGAKALGMTAIQLVAGDHDRHLAFAADTDWDGHRISALAEVLAYVS